MKKRIPKHKLTLRKGTHRSAKLQRSYDLHGADAFDFNYWVVECPKDELDKLEVEYIKQFDTVSNGYNSDSGGNLRKTLSEEHKRKIAAWNIGRVVSEETKRKQSQSRMGHKGTPRTEEQKKAQSLRMMGKQYNLGRKGYKLSEETKAKMSKSHMGNHYAKGSKRTPEQIQHLRETNLGRKHAPRTKPNAPTIHSEAFLLAQSQRKLEKELKMGEHKKEVLARREARKLATKLANIQHRERMKNYVSEPKS